MDTIGRRSRHSNFYSDSGFGRFHSSRGSSPVTPPRGFHRGHCINQLNRSWSSRPIRLNSGAAKKVGFICRYALSLSLITVPASTRGIPFAIALSIQFSLSPGKRIPKKLPLQVPRLVNDATAVLNNSLGVDFGLFFFHSTVLALLVIHVVLQVHCQPRRPGFCCCFSQLLPTNLPRRHAAQSQSPVVRPEGPSKTAPSILLKTPRWTCTQLTRSSPPPPPRSRPKPPPSCSSPPRVTSPRMSSSTVYTTSAPSSSTAQPSTTPSMAP